MLTRPIRAVLAVVLITGVAGASFFVSRKLSTSSGITPNAPSSKPFAADGSNRWGKQEGGNGTQMASEKAAKQIQEELGSSAYSGAQYNNARENIAAVVETYRAAEEAAIAAATPTPTPAPTTSPSSTAPANGYYGHIAGPGEYGYGTDKECGGFINGTYCVGDKRVDVNNKDTEKASIDAANKAQTKIANMTTKDLLKEAGLENGYNNCKNDSTCISDYITQATKKVLEDNQVVVTAKKDNLTQTLSKERVISDASNLYITEPERFKEIYGDGGGKPQYSPLLDLGVSQQTIDDLTKKQKALLDFNNPKITTAQLIDKQCNGVSYCIKGLTDSKSYTRDQVLISAGFPVDYAKSSLVALKENEDYKKLYTSTTTDYLTKTTSQLAGEYCKNAGSGAVDCIKAFKPELILSITLGLDKDSNAYKEALVNRKDQELYRLFIDPNNDSVKLAKEYCKNAPAVANCTNTFNYDIFLNQIKNPEIINIAKTNRNVAINNLITVVIPARAAGERLPSYISNSLADEVTAMNKKIQNAQAAYFFEKGFSTTIQENGKANKTALQSSIDFGEAIKVDPSLIDKYAKIFVDKKYQPIVDASKAYKIDTNTELNSVIKAQIQKQNLTTPIAGLYDGKHPGDKPELININRVSDEYKNQARKDACKNDSSISYACGNINSGGKVQTEALAQIDTKIRPYLQKILDNKIGYIPIAVSSKATTDNIILMAQNPDLIKKATNVANKEVLKDTTVKGPAATAPLKENNDKVQALANEYINRRLVEETYTRGTGIGGAIAMTTLGTTVGTAACLATGIFAVGSPACGVIGGVTGGTLALISNVAPILGEKTAKEIAAEKQGIMDFNFWGLTGDKKIFNNETVAGLAMSAYSNQGAASDTVDGIMLGGSTTRKNNPFANYAAISNTLSLSGATLESLSTDKDLQAKLALQSSLNQQFDAKAMAENNAAYVNAAVSIGTAGLSGYAGHLMVPGMGSLIRPSTSLTGITSNFANLAAQKFTTGSVLLNVSNSVLNIVQTEAGIKTVEKFVDTQEEIDYELCKNKSGAKNCTDEKDAVVASNNESAKRELFMALVTDTVVNVVTEVSSFGVELASLKSTPIKVTDNPLIKTDSTFISPELSKLLNISDPRILNGSLGDTDSITLANIIKSKNLSDEAVVTSLKNSAKIPTADTSIVQATVIYRDLPDVEFRAKLKEQGFSTADLEVALKIRESGSDRVLMTQLEERRLINQDIYDELFLDKSDTTEFKDIKLNEEVFSDEGNYFKNESEKLVAQAKKSIEASKPKEDPLLLIEKHTGIPQERLAQLTEDQLRDLSGLIQIVNDQTKTDSERGAFSTVLKSQVDRYLDNTTNLGNASTRHLDDYISDFLVEITGLPTDYLDQLNETEISLLKPSIDEYNNPNTPQNKKDELAAKVNTLVGELNSESGTKLAENITNVSEDDNFIVPVDDEIGLSGKDAKDFIEAILNHNDERKDNSSKKSPRNLLPKLGTDNLAARFLYEKENLNGKVTKMVTEELKNNPGSSDANYEAIYKQEMAKLIEKFAGLDINPDTFLPTNYSKLELAIQLLINRFIIPPQIDSPLKIAILKTESITSSNTTLDITKSDPNSSNKSVTPPESIPQTEPSSLNRLRERLQEPFPATSLSPDSPTLKNTNQGLTDTTPTSDSRVDFSPNKKLSKADIQGIFKDTTYITDTDIIIINDQLEKYHIGPDNKIYDNDNYEAKDLHPITQRLIEKARENNVGYGASFKFQPDGKTNSVYQNLKDVMEILYKKTNKATPPPKTASKVKTAISSFMDWLKVNINEQGGVSINLSRKMANSSELEPVLGGLLYVKKQDTSKTTDTTIPTPHADTRYTPREKGIMLKKLGIKQSQTELLNNPSLESYKILKSIGATDLEIIKEYPKMVERFNSSYILELLDVNSTTTWQEFNSKFESDEATFLWINAHLERNKNVDMAVYDLISKNTPLDIIDLYLYTETIKTNDTPQLPDKQRANENIVKKGIDSVVNRMMKNGPKTTREKQIFTAGYIASQLIVSTISEGIERYFNPDKYSSPFNSLDPAIAKKELIRQFTDIYNSITTPRDIQRYLINSSNDNPGTSSPNTTPTPKVNEIEKFKTNWADTSKGIPLKTYYLTNTNNTPSLFTTRTSAITIYTTLIACQSFIDTSLNTGNQMRNCFCAQMENECADKNSNEYLASEKIRDLYNKNIAFDSKNILKLFELGNGNTLKSINDCPEINKQRCNNNYVFCQWNTASDVGFLPGDVIVSSDDSKLICINPISTPDPNNPDIKISSCDTYTTDSKNSTIGSSNYSNDTPKGVWRFKDYSNVGNCWKN